MDNALLGIGLPAVLIGFATLAFGIKMAVALAIERLPEQTITPLLAMQAVEVRGDEQFDSGFINPAPVRQSHYVWEALPEAAPEPADNPANAAKLALGKRLFNEKKLSGDGTLSCAACHDLYSHAGADARPTALGIDRQSGPRNTPTAWNAAFMSRQFWDGRAASLEEQATGPILNPIEMGLPTAAEAERRLRLDASYRNDFVRGDAAALNPAQLRGMALFESTG